MTSQNSQAADQTIERPEEERKSRAAKVDFKMVTFSLGGKEYGIDIMNVKEIARANRFTYVPNTAPFVRGVYNMRGEIISVIDLREMFHLPVEKVEEGTPENLLILRVDDHVYGMIVDSIDKVVGISQSSIQPPHPIFGEINVRYIQGIVENEGKLYIILDIARIFDSNVGKDEVLALREASLPGSGAARVGSAAVLTSGFVKEELYSFRNFAVTALNEDWFRERYAEWERIRKGGDVQLHTAAEADAFLEGFLSPSTGALWEADYLEAFLALLPDTDARSLNVWNPGCGKGYETWSLACALRKRYPLARVKIWANDSDLLAISMAPNLVFDFAVVPEPYREYLVKGAGGHSFVQAVRDSIFFEFHDVLNTNPLPPMDLILCRDMLSFLAPLEQGRVLNDFREKLKGSGFLILGTNEKAATDSWRQKGSGAVSAFVKA
ncbi:MAG TPA: chemotaxis protein CheW [Magnetospirillaceae bacterium]|nr:chemotaxis protein CheW [Magnetospirillaceae bacterium]